MHRKYLIRQLSTPNARTQRLRDGLIITSLATVLLVSACSPDGPDANEPPSSSVPEWAATAVFYQIFPERFANGDSSNDPTRESLELPGPNAPESWRVSDWTADWYARADWELESGPDFYENGVFQRRYGGDLQGVINRMDYLADLGINAIYFNPIFYARSLHKYDGSSFHHVDPYFGPDPAGDFALMATETADPDTWHWTAADKLFLDVLAEGKRRGIRIIIDGVWNHTGRDFFAFRDILENQAASPYADWYVVNQFDDPSTSEDEFSYESWWNVFSLPLFADSPDGMDLHAGPKAYIFESTRRWMDPNEDGDPSDGIDGWRLDVTEDVPEQFWVDWNRLVRSINPEAYTVSEIWGDASHFVHEAGFSATMNYHAFALPVKAFLIDNAVSASAFVELLETRRTAYDADVQPALQNLLDSHDTPRLASMIVNSNSDYSDPEWFDYDRNVSPRGGGTYSIRKPNVVQRKRQRLIALFQMTYVGAPMIYYGTEAGMWGVDDPDDRMPMTWPDMSFEPQTFNPDGTRHEPDAVGFDSELFNFYRDLIRVRRQTASLTSPSITFVGTDDDGGALAYVRGDTGNRALVVINAGDQTHDLTVSSDHFSSDSVQQLVSTGDGVTFQLMESGALQVSVPAGEGVVLVEE